jgi:hypothetical protein
VKLIWDIVVCMLGKYTTMSSPVLRESILRSIGKTLSLARDRTRSLAAKFCGFAAYVLISVEM